MSLDLLSPLQSIQLLEERLVALKKFFDYDVKKERLIQIDQSLAAPETWNEHQKTQALNKERVNIETLLKSFEAITAELADIEELLTLAVEENDTSTINTMLSDIKALEVTLSEHEFQQLFRGHTDSHSAYLDIQAGSGGTEAQDWAEMLLRMYLRWGERHGYKTTLTEISSGEVAGIKSATIHFEGEYAYGWLRTETGVHRLVRLSPFDSNQRRHTSFAAVFVSPEIQDDIAIEINPSDLRIDTYRASGAGGQHVQKTDSAIRITHLPTKVVVQCQNDRSQHRNRDQAMRQLKAKLHALKQQEQLSEQQARESEKREIGWGSQIRSYVLDDARIKDLRTGIEVRNIQKVLDGDIDIFLKASLERESSSHQ